jgi:hypothetical protein
MPGESAGQTDGQGIKEPPLRNKYFGVFLEKTVLSAL